LDSPFVLAAAGTLAIHMIMVIALDAVVVIYPYRPAPPAPRIDLVDVEVPPPPEPPKPPPPPVVEPEVPEEPPKEIPKPRARTVPQQRVQEQPPPTTEPPPATETVPGGSEVVQMEDIAPAARGVAVKQGTHNTGRVGRGGNGGGTGAGSGAGAAETPPPVSVATIKKRALPKGDYGYFNTGADYPAAAKQLGIEGPIRVRLIVDDKGKVKQAVLLNRLGHGLDELALARAKQIEFEPARDTEDRPVTSVVVWTFHMTLPK
jgi:protein TonB